MNKESQSADASPESSPNGQATAVTRHLDQAIEAAQQAQMPTSELLGLFHYYAHSIAASYRQSVIGSGTD